MKRANIYFRDEDEWKKVKLFLEILRSGLNKEQATSVVEAAEKVRGELAASTKGSIDKKVEVGFWGEEIPQGWRQHLIGGKLVWIEKVGDIYSTVSPDGTGAIDEYRAACEAQGIKLDA